jgi:hypothetical protein
MRAMILTTVHELCAGKLRALVEFADLLDRCPGEISVLDRSGGWGDRRRGSIGDLRWKSRQQNTEWSDFGGFFIELCDLEHSLVYPENWSVCASRRVIHRSDVYHWRSCCSFIYCPPNKYWAGSKKTELSSNESPNSLNRQTQGWRKVFPEVAPFAIFR